MFVKVSVINLIIFKNGVHYASVSGWYDAELTNANNLYGNRRLA